jgi:hypothetical protein
VNFSTAPMSSFCRTIDQPGRDHANSVATALRGIASNVRLLELPDLGPKEDVVDWARRGGNAQQLNALLTKAKPREALADDKAENDGLNEQDFGERTTKPPPREWLLGTTFCRTFLSSLIAAGGVGKTAVRYAQFLALASRRETTGEYVHHRSRVLVISLEDDDKELERRMLAAMMHNNIAHADIKGWLFTSAPRRFSRQALGSG